MITQIVVCLIAIALLGPLVYAAVLAGKEDRYMGRGDRSGGNRKAA